MVVGHRHTMLPETTMSQKVLKNYFNKTAAARKFGVPAQTLVNAANRGAIKTATTGCGTQMYFGPSVAKFAATKHRPQAKFSKKVFSRRRVSGRGMVHAVPESAGKDGRSLCRTKTEWGPKVTGRKVADQISCPRCLERSKYHKVV